MARFMHYYGYKRSEVLKLEAREYDFLCKCMIKAKANDDLEDLEIVSYPHLKDSKARNSARDRLVKRAETLEELEERIVTSDDLIMNGIKLGNIKDHIKD